jgi:beta-lactamase class A
MWSWLKVSEAGKQQVRVLVKPSLVIPTLLTILIATGCVAIEPTEESGVTPVVIPTRVPQAPTPTPTLESTRTSATPEATPTAVGGCAVTSGGTDAEATPASERLQSPQSVKPPAAVQPIATHTDLVLENQVKLLLGEQIDGYGVVAIDLASGRSISINPASVFYSASVFKVWVMYEVFHQESLGLLDLTDELLMTPYYDSFGLGPRATELCQRLTVQEAMEAMMSISDNAAAVLLQDLVGSPNINSSLEALGLTDSRLTTEDLTLTAQDMALLLEIIASGKAVDRESSEQMAALLESETFDNGLDAGVPSEATVAHKTGNWSNARHDVGIVFGPKSTYVIAILSDNRSGSYEMTQAISGMVYEAFSK